MANKAISELPQAQNVNNQDLFVLEQSGIAKKLTAETFITEQGIIDALAEALDGHGGIQSVTLSSVSGRIRTYLITFTDGSATTFQVYDGTTIERIAKTSTAGLVDTYTVFMNDGTTTFFTVTNGADGDVSEAMLNDALKNKAPVITETTESSAIANFTDGADDMVMHHVVAEINPVQDLSNGDPSPTNICPISGHTEVNVTRTGKNLYSRELSEYNVPIFATNGTSQSYPNVTAYWIKMKPNTVYTISGTTPSGQMFYIRWINCDENKGFISRPGGVYTSANLPLHFTTPSNCEWVQIAINQYDTNNLSKNDWLVQVEEGSTATAYEPYQGTTVTVDWTTEAGTVYGGTIDVATGLLTVTHKMWTADGTVPWTVTGEGTADATFYTGTGYDYDTLVYSNNGYSNYFKYSYSFSTRGTIMAYTNRININSGSGFTTLAELQAAFAETPLQVLYPIATPQTYQLTGQQLMTLLGTNNVWADTGNVSVAYPADTKMFIEKLTQPTEDDMTANQAITSGKFFMVGNNLYIATAAIASGAKIIEGTNATRLSLADALNRL